MLFSVAEQTDFEVLVKLTEATEPPFSVVVFVP